MYATRNDDSIIMVKSCLCLKYETTTLATIRKLEVGNVEKHIVTIYPSL